MKLLIACEFSGAVRDAFRKKGVDAWSCDIVSSEDNSTYHIIADALSLISDTSFDGLIAFPPCTDLCSSGARWFSAKRADGRQQASIDFFMKIANSPIAKIAIENPVGIMSTVWRKPDQVIQPWMFGHGETKATCLWLKGFRRLTPTNIVDGRESRIHKMGESLIRARERSRTFDGIASAMASQWCD